MSISVVIPAYNEEENIEKAVQEVFEKIPSCELVVVDDASTDDTILLLQMMQQKYPRLKVISNDKNSGHGYSVVKGLKEATGEVILYIDADRQIDLSHAFGGWDADSISGCRVNRHDKFFRKIVSFCLKMTILFKYGYYVRDANCPFKIYKREKLLPLLPELPKTYIIPIACLEVLFRKHKLKAITISTPHKPYHGVRQGKLQSINPVSVKFFLSAFKEIIKL